MLGEDRPVSRNSDDYLYALDLGLVKEDAKRKLVPANASSFALVRGGCRWRESGQIFDAHMRCAVLSFCYNAMHDHGESINETGTSVETMQRPCRVRARLKAGATCAGNHGGGASHWRRWPLS